MLSVANPYFRMLIMLAMILSLLSITGCSGCWRDPDATAKTEQEKKEEEKKKQAKAADYDQLQPVIVPGVMSDPKVVRAKRAKTKEKNDAVQKAIDEMLNRSKNRNFAKLGHWYDIRFQAIANNFDLNGDLVTTPVDASNRELGVTSTEFKVKIERPIALTKGQWKAFESSIYLPMRRGGQPTFDCSIFSNGRRTHVELGKPNLLAAYQHHLIVLTSSPDTFKFLDLAPSVRMPLGANSFSMRERAPFFYSVIPSVPGTPAPLPRDLLKWTTIAYVFWDDLDPDQLDEDQQTAMLDWLHFGGQLVISGPDSLERLENSFLGNYLPATAGTAYNLSNPEIEELNENWSLPDERLKNRSRSLVIDQKSQPIAVELNPHSTAQPIPGTGELVIERQLGRGRIVVTGFSLKSRTFRSWRSFDSFLNGALLRRRPRKFRESPNGDLEFDWVGDSAFWLEPLLQSTVRFLSRDLSDRKNSRAQTSADLVAASQEDTTIDFEEPRRRGYTRALSDTWHYGGFDADETSGVGGWTDDGAVSNSARATLLDAAGIAPPSATLVLQLLVGYLIVLVPVNWLIFRLMGKVEYAWVMAPVISILGAVVVIKMASLDLGFSRSNTQVAVLELQPGYERGHLTEYSALYTSLSTSYDVRNDTLGSQTLPFSSRLVNATGRRAPQTVTIKRTNKSSLNGLQIQSNTTQLLHAEHVVNVGGRITASPLDNGKIRIVNGSRLTLDESILVGKRLQDGRPTAMVARVGKLPPGTSAEVELTVPGDAKLVSEKIPQYYDPVRYAKQLWNSEFKNRSEVTLDQLLASSCMEGASERYENWFLKNGTLDANSIPRVTFVEAFQELNPINQVTVGRVLGKIDQTLTLGENALRLYAITDQKVGGSRFEPESTQTDRLTLVVAHLTHPKLVPTGRDVNSPADFLIESDRDRDLKLFSEDQDGQIE